MDSSLWRNQSFLRLWIAQAVSNAGTKVTEVALPLTAVVVLSATPAQMGLLSMAGSLPNLLIGLPAGVWIDRSRRRPILVGADIGRALLLGSIPVAAWLGGVTFLHLWIVAFLAGILSVFFQIAAMAVLPAVVSKEQIVEANSKLSMTDSVISLVGSGAAGALVQLLSAPKAIIFVQKSSVPHLKEQRWDRTFLEDYMADAVSLNFKNILLNLAPAYRSNNRYGGRGLRAEPKINA